MADAVKLPFWRTVYDAHSVTLKNLVGFVRIGWLWALLLVTASAAINWAIFPAENAAQAAGHIGTKLAFLPMLASMFIGVLVAVPWHRLVLQGRVETLREAPGYLWPAIRYFGWLIAFSAIYAIPFWIAWVVTGGFGTDLGVPADPVAVTPAANVEEAGATDGDPDQLVGVILAFGAGVVLGPLAILSYIPTRLMLILPAVAIADDGFTVARSWAATAKNFWRLYLGSLLAMSLPLVFIIALLAFFGEETPTRSGYTFEAVVADAFCLVAGMIYVTYMSLAYRHLVQKPATMSAQ